MITGKTVLIQSTNSTIQTIGNQTYDLTTSFLQSSVSYHNLLIHSKNGLIELNVPAIGASGGTGEIQIFGNLHVSEQVQTFGFEDVYLSEGIYQIDGAMNFTNEVETTIFNGILTGNGYIQTLILRGDSPNSVRIIPNLISTLALARRDTTLDILTIDKLNGSLSNSPILNFQIAGFYQYAQICIQSVIGNPELSLLIEKVPSMNNELPPNSYELIFSDSYDPFGDLFYSNNIVSDCTPITLEGLPIQTVKPQFSNIDTTKFSIVVDDPPFSNDEFCSQTCIIGNDCTCCVNVLDDSGDPDGNICGNNLIIDIISTDGFIDPEDSSTICYTENNIQQSELIEIQYRVFDGYSYSNISTVFVSFSIISTFPSNSASQSKTISPSLSDMPIRNITISPTVSASITPTISESATISMSASKSSKQSLEIVGVPIVSPNEVFTIAPSNSPKPSSSRTVSQSTTQIQNDLGNCNSCEYGSGEITFENSSNNNNNDANDEIEITLVSDDGDIVGSLIMPSTIAPDGSVLTYSFVSGIETTNQDIGGIIIDINIYNEFSIPITNLNEDITICLKDKDADNVITIIFNRITLLIILYSGFLFRIF